jgi:UDP:flavonoid glycosyltransferase YjiC (YdhE family)
MQTNLFSPGLRSYTPPLMSRILFTTIGSLGDLHPLIAIGLELQRRGHSVRFCTSEGYRDKLQSLGFGFHALRPNAAPGDEISDRVREIFDPRKGPERLLRDWILPELRSTYADLVQAAMASSANNWGQLKAAQDSHTAKRRATDLLVSGELVYAAPLVAEKFGVPWASCITTPMSFFSAYDLPILPPVQTLSIWLKRFGPRVNRGVVRLIKASTRKWGAPVQSLRAELGLAPGADPIYEGKFSPQLVLAMFSSVLARPQPDWPPNTVITGFPFFDGIEDGTGLPAEIRAFLDQGEAPLVFTLGSSAVFDPGTFYEQSATAAGLVKRRAVLLTGRNAPKIRSSNDIVCYDYVRFSELFARAATVVHQGGVGTTAQVMRAGCQMLVMPYGFDQPDNAVRIQRLGLGRTISRKAYSGSRVAECLHDLLECPFYRENAVRVSKLLQRETGAVTAAQALEKLLEK